MKLCAFRCLISRTQSQNLRSLNQIQIFSWKITSFSKTTLITSEGAVTHNVLYYQQLSRKVTGVVKSDIVSVS